MVNERIINLFTNLLNKSQVGWRYKFEGCVHLPIMKKMVKKEPAGRPRVIRRLNNDGHGRIDTDSQTECTMNKNAQPRL